jgi:hypothetical protein
MLQPHQLSTSWPTQWIYNLSERLEKAFKKMVISYLPNISFTTTGTPSLIQLRRTPGRLWRKQPGGKKRKSRRRRFPSISSFSLSTS